MLISAPEVIMSTKTYHYSHTRTRNQLVLLAQGVISVCKSRDLQ